MLMDVFSGFDAYNMSWLTCGPLWGMCLFIVPLLNSGVWAKCNTYKAVCMEVTKVAWEMGTSRSMFVPGFGLFLSSLFILLLGVNLMGVVPFSFSVSSHLSFCMTYSLLAWGSIVGSSVCYSFKDAFAVYVPDGVPFFWASVLFVAEMFTVGVRPISLGMRLCMNMIAGHVFLGLLMDGLVASTISGLPSVALLLGGVCMVIMEVVVGVVQAYVFCLLLAMYIDEHSGLQDAA